MVTGLPALAGAGVMAARGAAAGVSGGLRAYRGARLATQAARGAKTSVSPATALSSGSINSTALQTGGHAPSLLQKVTGGAKQLGRGAANIGAAGGKLVAGYGSLMGVTEGYSPDSPGVTQSAQIFDPGDGGGLVNNSVGNFGGKKSLLGNGISPQKDLQPG